MIDAPIVSKNVRIRHPDHFVVGEGSIVDDFCYFSTKVTIGRYSHIAANCTVAGGGDRHFSLGDYSSVSSGARIWCTSDDFVNDIVCILPSWAPDVKEHSISGDVAIGHFTGIGSNAVIMPRNTIPEGTVVGALSFVPAAFAFEPWSVYAGTPIRLVGRRSRDAVMRQVETLNRHGEALRAGARGMSR